MREETDQRAKESRIQSDEDWKKSVAAEKERLRQENKQEPAAPDAEAFPEADVRIFLAGLYTQTLICLGDVAHPATGKVEQSLPEAQYLIDTIAMLKEKMRGNLTADESAYVDGVLYDLRMRFVSAAAEEGAPGVSEETKGKT